MGNWIDVNKVGLRSPPPFVPERLRVMAVANVSRWHGYDRFIEGMARYHGGTNVELDIIGDGPEIENLKRITNKTCLTDRVRFHPYTCGYELDNIFDKCHLGLASLGVHRNGLTQSCVLKAREYCARGIPFLDSGKDSDFPLDFPFRLQIPEGESPIEIDTVVRFAQSVLHSDHHASLMREFAKTKLDARVKMAQMASYLRSL